MDQCLVYFKAGNVHHHQQARSRERNYRGTARISIIVPGLVRRVFRGATRGGRGGACTCGGWRRRGVCALGPVRATAHAAAGMERLSRIPETAIAVQCNSGHARRHTIANHFERAVQAPRISRVKNRLSGRLRISSGGNLVFVREFPPVPKSRLCRKSRIGAQHSIARPSMSVARRAESAGRRSQWFQMIGAPFVCCARSSTRKHSAASSIRAPGMIPTYTGPRSVSTRPPV